MIAAVVGEFVVSRLRLLLLLGVGVVAGFGLPGCGPSAGPDSEWYLGAWFETPEGDCSHLECFATHVSRFEIRDDGTATVFEERVCGAELPAYEAEWRVDDDARVVLAPTGPEGEFRWAGDRVSAAELLYVDECASRSETESFHSEKRWTKGSVRIEQFTEQDCYGDLVAVTQHVCTEHLPEP